MRKRVLFSLMTFVFLVSFISFSSGIVSAQNSSCSEPNNETFVSRNCTVYYGNTISADFGRKSYNLTINSSKSSPRGVFLSVEKVEGKISSNLENPDGKAFTVGKDELFEFPGMYGEMVNFSHHGSGNGSNRASFNLYTSNCVNKKCYLFGQNHKGRASSLINGALYSFVLDDFAGTVGVDPDLKVSSLASIEESKIGKGETKEIGGLNVTYEEEKTKDILTMGKDPLNYSIFSYEMASSSSGNSDNVQDNDSSGPDIDNDAGDSGQEKFQDTSDKDARECQTNCSSKISKYDFESGKGGIVKDRWGRNDGLIEGSAKFSTNMGSSGLGNYSLEFSGNRDYVRLYDKPAFEQDNFTFSVWVNFDKKKSYENIISKWGHGGDQYNLQLSQDGEELIFTIETNQTDSRKVRTAFVPEVNEWHHYAFSWDGNQAVVYVDGEFQSSAKVSGSLAHGSEPLLLGAENNGSKVRFDGEMDNVRVYGRALENSQVSEIYSQESGGVENLGSGCVSDSDCFSQKSCKDGECVENNLGDSKKERSRVDTRSFLSFFESLFSSSSEKEKSHESNVRAENSDPKALKDNVENSVIDKNSSNGNGSNFRVIAFVVSLIVVIGLVAFTITKEK